MQPLSDCLVKIIINLHCSPQWECVCLFWGHLGVIALIIAWMCLIWDKKNILFRPLLPLVKLLSTMIQYYYENIYNSEEEPSSVMGQNKYNRDYQGFNFRALFTWLPYAQCCVCVNFGTDQCCVWVHSDTVLCICFCLLNTLVCQS